MANHHSDLPPEFSRRVDELRDALDRRQRPIETLVPNIELGKQNDFPAGQYGPSDEGAIAFAVGADADNGKIIIDFKSPVHWLAMDTDQARQLGTMLVRKADAVVEIQRGRALKKAERLAKL